jgi:multidrug efflux system membrane fusion protein
MLRLWHDLVDLLDLTVAELRARLRGRTAAIIGGAAAVALGAIFLLNRNDDETLAVGSSPRVPVVVARVEKQDFPIVLTGIGNVTALNTAVIRSQVTGLVKSVDFREGQFVKRGDLLAQIDPRTFQAQLEEAKGALGRDLSHLSNAEINLRRYLGLQQQNAIAEQMLANQQAAVLELKNDIVTDKGAIALAQTQLSYTALIAPFDGVTGIRLLDVGNVIQPTNTTGIVVVTQIQPISVLFTLASTDIPRVTAALAQGPVNVAAFSQDDTRRLDTGRLVAVNNQANPSSGTVQLKAIFPNARRQLWPGTFVNIHVTVSVRHDGLTVPLDAVQQGAHGQIVFLVDRNHNAVARNVEVADTQNGVALIGSGLKTNEQIVVRGQYRLVDGAPVKEIPSRFASTVPNSSTASAGMLP